MSEKLTHQEIAQLIEKYHQRAIEIYEYSGSLEIKIARVKHVEICETGAFIEAMVWVPKNEI